MELGLSGFVVWRFSGLGDRKKSMNRDEEARIQVPFYTRSLASVQRKALRTLQMLKLLESIVNSPTLIAM